jgi:Zn-dependent peptidase ImmA (M78 family)
MKLPKLPFYDYAYIRQFADGFLSKYNPTEKIPIDIDFIAESELGLNIIPIPNLPEAIDGGGFLSDLKDIYVDDYVFNNNEGRYRFTIAHEIGHLLLHKEYYQELNISSIEDYQNYQATVDPTDLSFLENHANNFAGLVLVPEESLQAAYAICVKKILDKSQRVKGFPDVLNDIVCETLSKKYLVHKETIRIRLDKDGLSHGNI